LAIVTAAFLFSTRDGGNGTGGVGNLKRTNSKVTTPKAAKAAMTDLPFDSTVGECI
jgi:hypothetical protein